MTETCLASVQQYDYERYLTTLFAPRSARPSLWALYAFNLEIAKTREVTTQATIGLIRLQWWRDAIVRLFEGKVDKHDVIQRLDTALKTRIEWHEIDFQILIEAREHDLYDDILSESDFWEYCLETSAPLLRLALKATHEIDDDAVIEHVGQAYAAIGLLRASSIHKAQGKNFLPDLSIEKIVTIIEEKIAIKPSSKIVRLFRALVIIHLKKLKAAKYDSAHPSFVQNDPLLPFKLWLSRS